MLYFHNIMIFSTMYCIISFLPNDFVILSIFSILFAILHIKTLRHSHLHILNTYFILLTLIQPRKYPHIQCSISGANTLSTNKMQTAPIEQKLFAISDIPQLTLPLTNTYLKKTSIRLVYNTYE